MFRRFSRLLLQGLRILTRSKLRDFRVIQKTSNIIPRKENI